MRLATAYCSVRESSVSEHIRKIEGAEKVGIIVISAGGAMLALKEEALAVGCYDCLEKPLARESFRAAIIRGLERRGYWTVSMGLEHFGHVMKVVARTAAGAVVEGLVQPGVAFMTRRRAMEKEVRASLLSRPTPRRSRLAEEEEVLVRAGRTVTDALGAAVRLHDDDFGTKEPPIRLEGEGKAPGEAEQVLALEAVPDDDPQEPIAAKDATDQAKDTH